MRATACRAAAQAAGQATCSRAAHAGTSSYRNRKRLPSTPQDAVLAQALELFGQRGGSASSMSASGSGANGCSRTRPPRACGTHPRPSARHCASSASASVGDGAAGDALPAPRRRSRGCPPSSRGARGCPRGASSAAVKRLEPHGFRPAGREPGAAVATASRWRTGVPDRAAAGRRARPPSRGSAQWMSSMIRTIGACSATSATNASSTYLFVLEPSARARSARGGSARAPAGEARSTSASASRNAVANGTYGRCRSSSEQLARPKRRRPARVGALEQPRLAEPRALDLDQCDAAGEAACTAPRRACRARRRPSSAVAALVPAPRVVIWRGSSEGTSLLAEDRCLERARRRRRLEAELVVEQARKAR